MQPPVVGSRQFAFEADDGYHVEMVFEKLRIERADKRAVGEYGKDDVLHRSGAFQQVAAHQRFTSSQQAETDTQLGGLLKDGAPLFRREGRFLVMASVGGNAILSGIATLALQIAGGGDTGNK